MSWRIRRRVCGVNLLSSVSRADRKSASRWKCLMAQLLNTNNTCFVYSDAGCRLELPSSACPLEAAWCLYRIKRVLNDIPFSIQLEGARLESVMELTKLTGPFTPDEIRWRIGRAGLKRRLRLGYRLGLRRGPAPFRTALTRIVGSV